MDHKHERFPPHAEVETIQALIHARRASQRSRVSFVTGVIVVLFFCLVALALEESPPATPETCQPSGTLTKVTT